MPLDKLKSSKGRRSKATSGVDLPRGFLRDLCRSDIRYQRAKVILYLVAWVGCTTGILASDNLMVAVVLQVLLGVVFAHGLELQHEALHGNLLGSKLSNRFFGVLFGLPMLVSFTHYQGTHLHHHKYVGTAMDSELFGYSANSLVNPISLVVRAWNLLRIPTFLVTTLKLLQNEFPEEIKARARKRLVVEYLLLLTVFIFALLSVFAYNLSTILYVWFIPWLLIAEPLHFLIEVPEHIGCDRADRSILRNTRSYPVNAIWGYISNHNNYHIEHHMFPAVPAHKLAKIHPFIVQAGGHCSPSYCAAMAETFSSPAQAQPVAVVSSGE